MKYKILVISHGHPDFRIGGGEKAAYWLYKGYNELADVEKAYFLSPSFREFNGRIIHYKDNEYFWNNRMTDFFFFRSEALISHHNSKIMLEFLKTINPDIVHFHHYVHIGMELIKFVKNILPKSKILLTLHEFLPICYHNGQMVKKYDLSLCERSSLEECNECFPDIKKEWFFLRKHKFMRIFDYVDAFISPSYFLKSRFVEWGIPENRIHVIENGFPDFEKLTPRSIKEGEGRNVFGFFGQINIYKGLAVVLNGLIGLKKRDRKKIKLYINGNSLQTLPEDVKNQIEKPLTELMNEGVAFHLGPYKGVKMQKERMKRIDWVIMPSIWWENSPMIIQEAYGFGRPLLVSGIGGMAEKVIDGLTGFHIPVSDPIAWAEKMVELADPENTHVWDELYNNLPRPPNYIEVAKKHIDLINYIL
ncbi:MAG: glycosyltransferase [candidate division WOR-3 bacterium]